jgi:hypothetical protein
MLPCRYFYEEGQQAPKGPSLGHGIEDYGGKYEPKRRTEIVIVSSFCGS